MPDTPDGILDTQSNPWPTILISGGHITPALATIEYLQKEYPEIRIAFVGREYSQVKERQVAKERELSEELGIPFYSVKAAKFHRIQWWRNGEELLQFFPSLYQAWRILQKEQVQLFLSFGGYLAVPFAIVAKLTGRKVVTHEQTKTTGMANELIARFADKVAISYEESKRLFPKEKVVLTGNPLRPSLFRTYTKAPTWLPESKKPILYITGGSQGSQTINNAVGQILPMLTEKFLVIHQCGQSQNQHYLKNLTEIAEELPNNQRQNYVVREWIEEKEVSWIMQHAALAVSRSGANTTLEMTLRTLPAIFIPLPFSHNNEQLKNAEKLVDADAAVLLDQKDLTPEKLLQTILEASSQRSYMRRRLEKLQSELITDGAERLGELCVSLLRSSS